MCRTPPENKSDSGSKKLRVGNVAETIKLFFMRSISWNDPGIGVKLCYLYQQKVIFIKGMTLISPNRMNEQKHCMYFTRLFTSGTWLIMNLNWVWHINCHWSHLNPDWVQPIVLSTSNFFFTLLQVGFSTSASQKSPIFSQNLLQLCPLAKDTGISDPGIIIKDFISGTDSCPR